MRSLRAVLEGITEWVWDPARKMKGWELGGRPDLLPENDTSANMRVDAAI